jgi:predicted DNA-binding protein (UPF0278 family)
MTEKEKAEWQVVIEKYFQVAMKCLTSEEFKDFVTIEDKISKGIKITDEEGRKAYDYVVKISNQATGEDKEIVNKMNSLGIEYRRRLERATPAQAEPQKK